jgi:hypothetical protein
MYISQQPDSVFYKYSPKCVALWFIVESEDPLPETCHVDVFYESMDLEMMSPVLVEPSTMESLVVDRDHTNKTITFHCRLSDISKNHMGKRFVFGISFPGKETLFTTPVDMLSKQVRPRKRKRTSEEPLSTTTVPETKKRTMRDILLNVEGLLQILRKASDLPPL